MFLLMPLRMQQFRAVLGILTGMFATSRILETRRYLQHGTTTVFTHCCNVAYVSLKLASLLHWNVDEQSLVRGALLHDYFLYDWHDRSACLPFHGFRHPVVALRNASAIYALSPVEVDIIRHHMFPLTLCPPATREGVLICVSDKLCALYETFKMNEHHKNRRLRRLAKRNKIS